jgi:hypothetical protein
MNARFHVIPVGGNERVHYAALRCWCHPLEKKAERVVTHNAQDCREAQERQGKPTDGHWVIVGEME